MFLARRRYLSTDLSAEEANQFDRDNCDAYDFSSEQSRWYLTELSHVRFLHWKVSGWLRLENNLVRSVRHAGVQVLVLLESGGHPGSGNGALHLLQGAARAHDDLQHVERRLCGSAVLPGTVYFAEDARRHGFIEAITIPMMPKQDVFYLTDQYLAGLPG
jgi:hypothetical protein